MDAQITFGWLQVVFLFAAVFFAVIALAKLYHKKHKTHIMLIKRKVFALIGFGVAALAVGYLVKYLYAAFSLEMFPGPQDLFFIMGYLSLAAGFAFFWYESSKLHTLHIKEPIFIFGVICGVFLWLYYLFMMSIMPNSASLSLGGKLLNYFYPVMVSLIFIFTLVVHPRMKARLIRTPLWYLSSGVFTYFIGFMIYTYSLWNTTLPFVPMVYSAFMMLSALYFCLGFYAAKKKYSVKSK
jgi:uncharacterized membrane protein